MRDERVEFLWEEWDVCGGTDAVEVGWRGGEIEGYTGRVLFRIMGESGMNERVPMGMS
jgi:hypothetical protein